MLAQPNLAPNLKTSFFGATFVNHSDWNLDNDVNPQSNIILTMILSQENISQLRS